ncbi:hypothetical protein BF49_5791 [Bradyrhizobium sp.]|nr:hypothetical protein BF49_5789 [Bradyrhizobium sp.]CUT14711.1 hypothetical protein BF49_5791 [Bradyrhizobium sp.]
MAAGLRPRRFLFAPAPKCRGKAQTMHSDAADCSLSVMVDKSQTSRRCTEKRHPIMTI